jgi:hypothetical protein
MVATYSSKKNIKYRYYVCHTAQSKGYSECPTKSINAQSMERTVLEKLVGVISASPELKGKNLVINTPAWEVLFPQERRRVLNSIVKSVEYEGQSKKLAIELDQRGIEDLCRELA